MPVKREGSSPLGLDTIGIAAGVVLIVYCFLTGKMKKNSAQPA